MVQCCQTELPEDAPTNTTCNPTHSQTVSRAHEKAEVGLQTTAKELLNVRETLASSREREETERSRFEQECKKSAALRARLEASETQRKIQEEEISFVKKQVTYFFTLSEFDVESSEEMKREMDAFCFSYCSYRTTNYNENLSR